MFRYFPEANCGVTDGRNVIGKVGRRMIRKPEPRATNFVTFQLLLVRLIHQTYCVLWVTARQIFWGFLNDGYSLILYF